MGWPKRNVKSAQMPNIAGSYEIQTQARGPHWIAWITREGGSKPERSIVFVGATEKEAEAGARAWAEQSSY